MSLPDPVFWKNFWPSFWSNVAADIIVGVLITGLISWVITRSKKVDAKVVLAVAALNESTLKLIFSVRNTGRIGFPSKEIYWHVFVNRELYIAPPSLNQDGLTLEMMEEARVTPIPAVAVIRGKQYSHYRGLIDGPVFPSRLVEVLTVKTKSVTSGQHDCLYYLPTAHGLFPKSLKTDKEGDVLLDTIGKVKTLPSTNGHLAQ
jgi:hypothetical protein